LWKQTEEKTISYAELQKPSKVGLDHNHSHFILVEDKVSNSLGNYSVSLRGEFEPWRSACLGAALAKHTSKSDEDEQQPVPVISICGTEPCT
jgi:hypothetical protein